MRDAIIAEDVDKFFPPTWTGWRAMLQPLARPTWRALEGIGFSVRAGEAVALIGPNGAGKSTLLRIVATLLLPTRGRVRVAGFDIRTEADRVRERIGLHAGGDGGFYARLTGRQNLRFFAALNRLSRKEADERMEVLEKLLGLSEGLGKQVRTLSTGTVHRLSLARAILHRPSILLLDEPTRSLDPIAAAEFRRLLRDSIVRREGTTLFFATHSLQEVAEIADRVLVLDRGRAVAFDTPARLLEATGADSLESAMGRLTGHAEAAEGAG